MTSIEQWENFMEYNTEDHADSYYTFTSDIDFMEIFPNGCTSGITIYPEVRGNNTTWKNLFLISSNPLHFKNGVSYLNFKNMFGKGTFFKYGKLCSHINMEVSLGGGNCTITSCTDTGSYSSFAPVEDSVFVIRGNVSTFNSCAQDDESASKFKSCVYDLDINTSITYLDRSTPACTTYVGRISGSSYIRTAMWAASYHIDQAPDFDPENPQYVLRDELSSAMFNVKADSTTLQWLDYHYGTTPIFYNYDRAPFNMSASGLNGYMIPTTAGKLASGEVLEIKDPINVYHTLPYWRVSTKYQTPVPENFDDNDTQNFGAFNKSSLKYIELPADCQYCRQSFPATTTVQGGTLCTYD